MVDSNSRSAPASARFRPSADVVFRHVGDEAVLVPLRQNVGNLDWVYTLSPVAARVWQLLDGVRSLGEVVALICEEFDVEPAVAEADVAELIASLREAGLVVEGE